MISYNFLKIVINIDIYQHFRQEEYELIDQLTDKCDQTEQHHAPVLTHFLGPGGQYALEAICGSHEGLNVSFYGEPNAERKRAIIPPSYYEPKESDFDLTSVEIGYPEKFVTLKYQHVLGILMSSGIEREQARDVIVNKRTQPVLISRLGPLVMLELQCIKGVLVKLYTIPIAGMIQPDEDWKIESATVSSLRLDVVTKEVIRKSHTTVRQLIEKKRVKVSHAIVDSANFQLQTNDLIPIRGFGKTHIADLGGRTKENKTHITCRTLFKQ